MAWIEQTKKGSRKSGGPQYYLQDLKETSSALLEKLARRPVRLWTPYGVVDSGLIAVSRRVGSVGHDRVQSGGKVPSIADQIAYWFGLNRADIERIEFDDSLDANCFVIRPSQVKFFGRKARKTIYPDTSPLTVISGRHSALLVQHLLSDVDHRRRCRNWVKQQLDSLVREHEKALRNVDERDLLRASGALDKLGVYLGMYRRQGIDCPDATFAFCGYPAYPCPVEIEERSSGFLATHHSKHRRERLVLLCMVHDAPEVLQGYVDVIELRELGRMLEEVA